MTLEKKRATGIGEPEPRNLPIAGKPPTPSTVRKISGVDHPVHYNAGDIEAIDYIEDCGFGPGFNLGNAIKYIARAAHKGDLLKDLQKARWYLDREISRLDGSLVTKTEQSYGRAEHGGTEH